MTIRIEFLNRYQGDFMLKRGSVWLLILVTVVAFGGCGNPEKKKMKFFQKGESLYEQGDYTAARIEFKNALQIDPKFAKAYHMIGMVELQEKNFRGAFGNFSKAVELDPESLDSRLQLGKIYLAAGEKQKSRDEIEIILQSEPNHQEGRLLRATLLASEGDLDGSNAILDSLVAEGFHEPNLYLMRYTIETRRDNLDAAESALKEGLEKNPDSVRMHLATAQFYYARGNYAAAEDEIQKAIELEPDQVRHRFNLAVLLWQTDQRDQADEVLSRIRSAQPQNEENRMLIARFYQEREAPEKAIEILQQAVKEIPESYRIRFMLSELYLEENQIENAQAILLECLELDASPDSPGVLETQNRLARYNLALNRIDQAEQYVDQVLEQSPGNVDAHFLKGTIWLHRRNGAQAIPEFRAVVDEKPDYIQGHIRLAEAHLLNDERELAMNVLQEAQRQNPDSREIVFATARLYSLQKDYAQAERQLSDYLEKHSDDAQLSYFIGDILLAQEKFDQAVEQYRTAMQQDIENPNGYLRLARLHGRQGQPEAAIEILRQGHRRLPQNPVLMVALVKALTSQGRYEDAFGLIDTRLAESPDDAFSYNLRGQVWAGRNDFEKSEADFLKAIQIRPSWQVPHYNLARLYLAQGKQAQAIERFESMLANNPTDMPAYLSLGYLYEQSGDLNKAISTYEKALENVPDSWAAANNLAFVISENHDSDEKLDEALKYAELALEKRPEEPVVLDTVGWIYYQKGDFARAGGYLEKALEKDGDNPIFNYHYGMILANTGRPLEAVARLESALATGKDFQGREDALQALEAMRKQG
jgi:tetratricopeptide (TPR) repeat protein